MHDRLMSDISLEELGISALDDMVGVGPVRVTEMSASRVRARAVVGSAQPAILPLRPGLLALSASDVPLQQDRPLLDAKSEP